jgi:hypothetical protein
MSAQSHTAAFKDDLHFNWMTCDAFALAVLERIAPTRITDIGAGRCNTDG